MRGRIVTGARVTKAIVVVVSSFAPVLWGAEASQKAVRITHYVEIRGFEFKPSNLSVSPGDSIVFMNLDIVPHTATAIDNTWTTDTLETGETQLITITSDSTPVYYCIFHPSMNGSLDLQ